MTVTGSWQITIATPLGIQSVVLQLSEHAGVLEGVAQGRAETTPLDNLVRDGNRLTWTQAITKPMRLNLTFDVIIDGDSVNGTAKAGLLPASTISGHRVRDP
jgi:hypothetical protein